MSDSPFKTTCIPTPTEISQRSREIRATWTDAERSRRATSIVRRQRLEVRRIAVITNRRGSVMLESN